ncbi:MAG: oligomeric, coiled-coil, peripheral membrane protein [Caeruleum heppii]|nr:MAG: oligomeric, coiled-coil, peripheral membrane protein [Caeruleum heppii]
MTARGRQVKLQTLLSEKELFVYDRLLISPTATSSSSPEVKQVSIPHPLESDRPPDTISSQKNLQAWQELFRSRKSWTSEVTRKISHVAQTVRQHADEAQVIGRAVSVATANLESHVRSLAQKNADAQAWAEGVQSEQNVFLESQEMLMSDLRGLAIKQPFQKFFALRVRGEGAADDDGGESCVTASPACLADLVDGEKVEQAVALTSDISKTFRQRVAEIDGMVAAIEIRSQELTSKVKEGSERESAEGLEEHSRLVEDISAIAEKVGSDTEHVLASPDNAKSISQASKIALLHTRNHLPSLSELRVEMHDFHLSAVEKRNAAAIRAVEQLQTVSAIESKLAKVNASLTTLDVSKEGLAAFDLLKSVTHLPTIYGSLLVESVRRRTWNEKLKGDSALLAEELARSREEEERRRRSWQRHLDGYINRDAINDRVPAVEINLSNDDELWPVVDKTEIQSYLQALQGLQTLNPAVSEVSRMVQDLFTPPPQRFARAKAFKYGSLHEAAIGASSWLSKDDGNMTRDLRAENTKLSDRLKGSESRIRKLEDLLHRQSHLGRTTSNNPFQGSGTYGVDQEGMPSPLQSSPPAPRPFENMSRRSSTSSRRFSANQVPEERTLARRIVSLEAEVTTERQKSLDLQREVAARTQELKGVSVRAEEANSTKDDLMHNLEAQQREFSDERRLLVQEMNRLRVRHEEVEDELDRVMGSRDTEKAGTDERVRALQEELERLQKRHISQSDGMRAETETLRGEGLSKAKEITALGRQNQVLLEEKSSLESRTEQLAAQLEQRDRNDSMQQKALQQSHLVLAPRQTPPAELTTLSNAVRDLTERSSLRIQDLETDLATAQSQIAELLGKTAQAEETIAAIRGDRDAALTKGGDMAKALTDERSHASTLTAQLEHEREQVSELSRRLADGDTGSEALRKQLDAELVRFNELQAKLNNNAQQVDALKTRVTQAREDANQRQLAADAISLRLEERSSRARDLTRRLYLYSDRLSRLLENLGFTIARRDDSVVLQRVSRVSSGTTADPDLSNSMSRSITAPAKLEKSTSDLADLEVLRWMQADDLETENRRYSEYIDVIGKIDVEAFSEAIRKRLKETEHLARKWQKEARSYRDKSHRFQQEAHDKIAFRSFKEGDLALFLPTRNQATRPWAAFNVGAPHYFLKEQDSHRLRTRDWLLARISKVEERVVDLSRPVAGASSVAADEQSIGGASDGGASFDDENPFELSDGLRWYLLDAAEEKPGAPSTPGLGKSTVASAHVDARGSIRTGKATNANVASRTLSKSLDSRRSSAGSRKGVVASTAAVAAQAQPPSGADAGDTTKPGSAPEGPEALKQLPSQASPPDAAVRLEPGGDAAVNASLHHEANPYRASQQPSPTKLRRPEMARKASEKSSVGMWDSLWSIDLKVEGGRKK